MGPERVAIVTAMKQEMRPLVRSLGLRRADLGDITAYRGTPDGRQLVAAVTGVGTIPARRVTEVVVDSHEVDRVLMVGVAGAVEPTLEIGALVIPAVVIDAATGTEYHPGVIGDQVPRGAILTTDQLLDDPSELDGLIGRGILAVDMESAAVGAVCRSRGIDWSVFRAISDRAGDPRTDGRVLELLRADGSSDVPAVLRNLRRSPRMVVHLARLARGSHAATRVAAAAASASLDV